MKKINNKGFMMAEVIVVAAVILTVMTSLYMSYSKIYSTYKQRLRYYDTTTLYRAAFYRDVLVTNLTDSNELLIDKVFEDFYINHKYIIDYHDYIGDGSLAHQDISGMEDAVYLIYAPNNVLPSNILEGKTTHITFKEYATYLSEAVKFETNYIMLVERCRIDEGFDTGSERSDCTYAYLELYPPTN